MPVQRTLPRPTRPRACSSSTAAGRRRRTCRAGRWTASSRASPPSSFRTRSASCTRRRPTTSGPRAQPMATAALGREWSDDDIEAWLTVADVDYERPRDIADAVGAVLADNGIVAWFQGRSEFGPRALGHRSLLADPRRAENLTRMNDVKGREQFRPVAPMVLADVAADIFEGVLPSRYMLFVHQIRPAWRDRIPAAAHVD